MDPKKLNQNNLFKIKLRNIISRFGMINNEGFVYTKRTMLQKCLIALFMFTLKYIQNNNNKVEQVCRLTHIKVDCFEERLVLDFI